MEIFIQDSPFYDLMNATAHHFGLPNMPYPRSSIMFNAPDILTDPWRCVQNLSTVLASGLSSHLLTKVEHDELVVRGVLVGSIDEAVVEICDVLKYSNIELSCNLRPLILCLILSVSLNSTLDNYHQHVVLKVPMQHLMNCLTEIKFCKYLTYKYLRL